MRFRQTISSWFSPSPSLPPTSTQDPYGLSSSFADLLAEEYPALSSSELIHLDHAASPPPPISSIVALTTALSANLYLNPHSHAPTHQEVDTMRGRVMQVLFGLKQRDQEGWDLVWTSGATASMKIVAEHFPWQNRTRYRYLKESHTSLVGIRGCALAGGAEVDSLDLDAFLLPTIPGDDPDHHILHAYPAQCNVTGSRLGLHPAIALAQTLKSRRANQAVLVDAAAYLSTSPLDLSTVSYEEAPDFVVGSFYKIYGHPTGLGFLLVRRSSAHLLTSPKDRYFGGGAIEALSVSSPYWVHPRGSKGHADAASSGLVHERFENGTVPYLSIVALGCAIDAHQRLYTARLSSVPPDSSSSLRAVASHTHHLATLARNAMTSLKHWDTNIQLRTGGLCNTGVMARISGLSDRELEALWEEGRVCGDAVEFGGDTNEKLLGIARISFGACSSAQDIEKFIDFLKRYFLISQEVVELSRGQASIQVKVEEKEKHVGNEVFLESLVRYPIKSCAGQVLTSSRLTPHGLIHDREFAIVNSATGKTMSQKQFPRMVLIRPSIDDDALQKILIVKAPGMPELMLPIQDGEADVDVVGSYRMPPEADEWVSKFLGVACQLHRFVQSSTSTSSSCSAYIDPSSDTHTPNPPIPILFSNESPFTLISTTSVAAINTWVASTHPESNPTPIHPSCFRANFTLSLPPFHEDALSHVRIGTQTFQVLARCRRCLMVCVDGATGVRMREPFCCLAKHRRNGKQRVEFGVHLMWRGELSGGGGDGGEKLLERAEPNEIAVIRVGDRIAWTVIAGHGGLES
ncbi:hypothetical protein DXG01_006419 [Tephrocybe rancida]|nr:hypothetical protein DXG01_006419 [Tephrocybe rancida]